jgi:hypothetical protein
MCLRSTLWLIGLLAIVAAPAAAVAQTADTHPQPGEVKYGEKWVDVAELFQQYKQAKQELAANIEERKAPDTRLGEINKTLAAGQTKFSQESMALQSQKAAADQQYRTVAAQLQAGQPQQPYNQQDPPRPNRGAYKDAGAYNNAVNDWNRRLDQIHRDNQTRQDNYNRAIQQYREFQQKGRKTLDEAKAKLDDSTKKIADLNTSHQAADKPLRDEKVKLTADQATRGQAALAIVNRINGLYGAIVTCPETILRQHGILEYRKSLYTVDETQAIYDKLKGEVDAARARATGGDASLSYTDSRQAEVEALKVMLDAAKAAAGGK